MADSSYASPLTKRDRYNLLIGELKNERTTFEAHWRELGENLLPRRTRWFTTDRNRGDRRNQNIYDSTARFAVRTLQSGLQAGLTSPARPWFRLTTPDPGLAEFRPVKEWCHTVTSRMSTVFQQSNLYNALSTLYGDLGVFGTAAVGVMEDEKDLFRCYSFPIGSYWVGLDERGLVTTFVREYILTVRQLVSEFGLKADGTIDRSRFSRSVLDAWDKSLYEQTVEVCWIVTPNQDVNPYALNASALPWSSCYFEKNSADKDKYLRESGFRQFPVLVPRWDVTGEDTYGTDCPGMTALGDVKQLQVQQKIKAKALAKMVDPPLVGQSGLRSQKVSLLPGDITYDDVREGKGGLRPIHDVNPRVAELVQDIRETQFRIQRAFYEDLFLMLASSDSERGAQPVTAREIDERHEEKLLALGPVLERTNDELLNPLIDRVFDLMLHAGLIPDPPPDLDGVKLRVEFTSLMAQAQRMVSVGTLDGFMQRVQGIAAVDPSVLDKVNTQQAVDDYGDMFGINPNVIRSDDEAAAIGQQRAQQQQKMLQAEQAAKMGQAAKALGSTPMDTNSALDRVVDGLAAGAPA